jgi:hypothetical protein
MQLKSSIDIALTNPTIDKKAELGLTEAENQGPAALVAITYWQDSMLTYHYMNTLPFGRRRCATRHPTARFLALQHTLQIFSTYPVNAKVLLASNRHVYGLEASSMIAYQVVQPTPRCNDTLESGYCLGFEALRFLLLYGRSASKALLYQYYMYLEADMEIPVSTFNFWASHTARLWSHGFWLRPHRREVHRGSDVVTEWLRPECTLRGVQDTTAASSYYVDQSERVFIGGASCEFYTGSWMMTQAQLGSLLTSDLEFPHLADWSRRHGLFQAREVAADWIMPRLLNLTSLTHPEMPVFHLLYCEPELAANTVNVQTRMQHVIVGCNLNPQDCGRF